MNQWKSFARLTIPRMDFTSSLSVASKQAGSHISLVQDEKPRRNKLKSKIAQMGARKVSEKQ